METTCVRIVFLQTLSSEGLSCIVGWHRSSIHSWPRAILERHQSLQSWLPSRGGWAIRDAAMTQWTARTVWWGGCLAGMVSSWRIAESCVVVTLPTLSGWLKSPAPIQSTRWIADCRRSDHCKTTADLSPLQNTPPTTKVERLWVHSHQPVKRTSCR